MLDFADFAAARRYVEQPLHQSFIEHHARTCLGGRVVVQHDWACDIADPDGIFVRLYTNERHT